MRERVIDRWGNWSHISREQSLSAAVMAINSSFNHKISPNLGTFNFISSCYNTTTQHSFGRIKINRRTRHTFCALPSVGVVLLARRLSATTHIQQPLLCIEVIIRVEQRICAASNGCRPIWIDDKGCLSEDCHISIR